MRLHTCPRAGPRRQDGVRTASGRPALGAPAPPGLGGGGGLRSCLPALSREAAKGDGSGPDESGLRVFPPRGITVPRHRPRGLPLRVPKISSFPKGFMFLPFVSKSMVHVESILRRLKFRLCPRTEGPVLRAATKADSPQLRAFAPSSRPTGHLRGGLLPGPPVVPRVCVSVRLLVPPGLGDSDPGLEIGELHSCHLILPFQNCVQLFQCPAGPRQF